MAIRSVSSEAVVGSNLAVFLPSLFCNQDYRFPSSALKLYEGTIKGEFHYIKADAIETHSNNPTAKRDL